MKRIVAILLSLILVFSVSPLSVSAADEEAIGGTCGENLIWTLADGVLTISGEGTMKDYVYNYSSTQAPWYQYSSQITKIVVEEGVTTIGDHAFYGCGQTVSIELPYSITSIGYQAFYRCYKLSGLRLPEQLTAIGKFAFYGCSAITNIHLPASVSLIGEGAFGDCHELSGIWADENNPNFSSDSSGVLFDKNKSVLVACPQKISKYVVPEGVMSIGPYAFGESSGLTEIVLPDGLQEIGRDAFDGCWRLSQIVLPDSVTSIGSSVFSLCFNLADVTLSANITQIPDYAFYGCESLREIEIPYGITTIGDHAFGDCNGLQSITIPDSVTAIGEWAFAYAYELTTVNFGSGLESIGKDAFYQCDKLDNVVIPGNVVSIGNGAFHCCDSIQNVVLSEGISTIGDYAFNYCNQLKQVIIPGSVTYIGNAAFGECERLSRIIVDENNLYYSSNSDGLLFNLDKTSLIAVPGAVTSCYIPDGVISIESRSLEYCEGLNNVFIPASVQSIGSGAFAGCDNLMDVYYGGTEEEWKQVAIDQNNQPLIDAWMHYGSSGPDIYVRYLWEWDSEKQIAYWDRFDFTGSQVSEQTDESVVDNINDYVGKYVLVETKPRNDNLIAPDTLINIQIVETKTGTVKEVTEEFINIDGIIYEMPRNIFYTEGYAGRFVLYHTINGELAGVEILNGEAGDFCNWNPELQKLTLDPEGLYNGRTEFTISPLADEDTASVLAKATTESVIIYWADQMQFIYRAQIAPEEYVPEFNGWGLVDEWSFSNYKVGRIPLADEDYEALTHSLDAAQKKAWDQIIQREHGGQCYGMAATAVLIKNGDLSLDMVEAGLESLYASEKTEAAKSVIGYYYLNQYTVGAKSEMSHFQSLTLTQQLNVIQYTSAPYLLGFGCDGWGAHAITVHGRDYGSWSYHGHDYDVRILTYDSNYGGMSSAEEGSYLYFNSETKEWEIPNYYSAGISSDGDGYFVMACGKESVLNNLDLETARSSYAVWLRNQTASNFSIVSDSTDYSITGPSSAILNELHVSYDLGYLLGSTEEPVVNVGLREEYDYTIVPEDSGILNISILYPDCYLSGTSESYDSITLKNSGEISASGLGDTFVYSLTFDEELALSPWVTIEITGSGATEVAAAVTEDGLLITGDNLSDITVSGETEDGIEEHTVSSEENSILVTQNEAGGMTILEDADGDGVYETDLSHVHTYDGPHFVWVGVECSANFVCASCGYSQTVSCRITMAENSECTATAEFQDQTYMDTQPVLPEDYSNHIVSLIPTIYGTRRTSFVNELPGGGYQAAVYYGGTLFVQRYDAGWNVTESIKVDLELPIWGGFYADGQYNYLACGRNADDTLEEGGEVYRVIKYDDEFRRLDSISFTANETYTSTPFSYGNVSIASFDNIMTVYTSRLRPDGHQSNIALRINTEDMSVHDSYGMGSYPDIHASHSFRQIVRYDGNTAVHVDLSDAYPVRSVYIQYGTVKTPLMELPGQTGDNVTNAEVSGLAVSDTHYFAVGSYLNYEEQNIFLSSINKETKETKTIWLTAATAFSPETLYAPRIVQIAEDKYVVMWNNAIADSVQYLIMDHQGNILCEQKEKFGVALTDCEPIFSADKILWLSVKDGAMRTETISDFSETGTYEWVSTIIEGDDVWDGTADTSWYDEVKNVFSITTPEQLAGLSELSRQGVTFAGKTVNLANDLFMNDLSYALDWPAIQNWEGTFNGNGHSIYNIYQYDEGGGLFHTIGASGIVKAVTLAQGIFGSGGCVADVNNGIIAFCHSRSLVYPDSYTSRLADGGICDENKNLVYGCRNYGTVIGESVAGVVGVNSQSLSVTSQCSNWGTVAGIHNASGVVAYTYGWVYNCYSRGTISSTIPGNLNEASYLAGVVGYWSDYRTGDIESCYEMNQYTLGNEVPSDGIYAIAPKGTVNCYSLNESLVGGTGVEFLTREQMRDESFVDLLNQQTNTMLPAWVRDENLINGGMPITIADANYEKGIYKIQPELWIGWEKSVTLNAGETKTTSCDTYYNEEGASVTVDDPNIAQVTLSGNSLTVVALKEGETRLTIHFAETENVIAAEYTIILYVNPKADPYSGKCGENINWHYEENSGQLTLDGYGEMFNYSSSGDNQAPWHAYMDKITSVVMSEGITSIGSHAFYNCVELDSVELPDSVCRIGSSAFSGCRSIKKLILSDNLSEIGAYAFNNSCEYLYNLEFPNGLQYIGDGAFMQCGRVYNITFPDTLVSIGKNAFWGNGSIREVVILGNLESIGEDAFYGCRNMYSLVFKGDAPSIGDDAFYGVTADAYYPRDNGTWTEELMQNYGGTITWIPVSGVHSYEPVVTAPTCEAQGYTTYTCTNCGDSYVGNYTDPIGHSYTSVVTAPTCQAQGYTTHTCARCDDSYVDSYVAALGHGYVDGICTGCGAEESPVYTVTYTTVSISLAGDIGVNYYVQLSESIVSDENSYMQFTVAGQTQTVPLDEAVTSTGTDGLTTYRFSCKVAAKQMTEDITGQFYLSDGTPVGEAKEYSVKAYCDAAIPIYSQYEAYAELVELMEAMLNYGAYSQVQFSYNTGNLANASMDTTLPEITADNVSAYAHGATGSEDGISVASVSLLLESTTTIRFYFNLDGSKSIDEYTFLVDGEEVTPVQSSENQYYVDKVNVAAKDLDEMVTVAIGGLAVKYCGLSYVRQVAVLYPTYYSEALVNVAKALYAYNQAANAYFA